MMKRKLTVFLLAGLLLALTGCTLAQPEKNDTRANRFLGFYVVYDRDSASRNDFWNNNSSLTEIGSMPLDTKWGRIDLPQTGLLAEKDGDSYTFPGLDGYSLFVTRETGPDGALYTDCMSDMDGTQLNISVTDSGTTETISGIVYAGPPLDAGPEWDRYTSSCSMTAYRVYESPEGTIYLDGSGNSLGGIGGAYTEKQTFTTAVNGEVSEENVEVKVEVRYAPRLETLRVSQFDAQNRLLRADDLALREDLPEVVCQPETAWVLAEEQSGEGTVRTAYSVPAGDEEPVSHTVVLLDDNGRGRTAELVIRRTAP